MKLVQQRASQKTSDVKKKREIITPLLLLMCIDDTNLVRQNQAPGGQLDPKETSKDIEGNRQP